MSNKEYSRRYVKEHRDKIREYNREWMRRKRAGESTIGIEQPVMKHKKTSIRMKGKCHRCEILLVSIYAVGHNGVYCGECIKETNDN
jgi:hypothetical protein